ncbi:transport and Golgi organization protein 2 isoform X2 [Zootermopsis nevadensis]|uniref:Ser/Thr-rich protein T10 in DGCR region n=2 Tax=Zootermopsis nevadensis TaxID=136037 RepID=A0A067R2Z1_ZOONE|nr:transport and Golgi organization protein 2 isoform X2 [Zootermopsis nevadensis]XP_021933399.1 transport and Golgi organization protein 2 isoform X2 [Zootermopsis nevadensis]KDR12151.1 hypothetical protein L798_13906 [Zootermopsis nevadensis]
MCILFLHTDNNPAPNKFRLILASNRDEYYQRPTRQANFWDEDPTVIGGRDLEPGKEGGSWLALSSHGRIGVILNVTGENTQDPSSSTGRGFIVPNFVTNKQHEMQEEYLVRLSKDGHKHSPFNFISIDISMKQINVQQYSNAYGCKDHAENVASGPRGWGNSILGHPFRKVTAGTSHFKEIVEAYGTMKDKDILVQELLSLLKWDKSHFPDPELQRRLLGKTPSVVERTSSVFVTIPEHGYGTRTHSIILINRQGEVDFMEWTMKEPIDPQNPTWISAKYTCQLESC